MKKNDGKYKGALIKKFNSVFGLDWEIDKNDNESADLHNNKCIAFERIDDQTLNIQNKSLVN